MITINHGYCKKKKKTTYLKPLNIVPYIKPLPVFKVFHKPKTTYLKPLDISMNTSLTTASYYQRSEIKKYVSNTHITIQRC